jgi:hypothetical protein
MGNVHGLVGFVVIKKRDGNQVYWVIETNMFYGKNPSIYRNLHISNKIAAELNGFILLVLKVIIWG